jgi:hypothetical protein
VRPEAFPDAATPLITLPTRLQTARTYVLYAFGGAWLGSAVSFSSASTTSVMLLSQDEAVWRHVLDASNRKRIADLREHLQQLEQRMAERARGDAKRVWDEGERES